MAAGYRTRLSPCLRAREGEWGERAAADRQTFDFVSQDRVDFFFAGNSLANSALLLLLAIPLAILQATPAGF